MNKPIFFAPNESLSAQLNLDAFINMCKNELKIFGEDLAFESNTWDVTKYAERKESKNIRIIFSNFEYARISNKKTKTSQINYMQEPFLTFSKAYVRYRTGINPVKNLNPIITSLRLLEHSLNEMKGYADSIDVSADVLTRAAQIAAEYYSDAVAYRHGQLLEELGEFLAKKRIAKLPIDWRNPISRPCDAQRIGQKADENRNRKMPSKKALETLPKIFCNATEPNDIIMISTIALLLGAPNRINEVLFLSYDCEFIQKNSQGNEHYGLRWHPAKGAEPMIKWILPSMVDVTKLSIKRIRELTAPIREIACWYESNPDSIFLPQNLEHLRKKEYISASEVSMILFGKESPHSIVYWFKQHNIPYFTKTTKEGSYKVAPKKTTTVRFKDLEKAVIKLLPINFPYLNKEVGIKYSQALLVKRINEFHNNKGTLLPTVAGFTIGSVNDALGARSKELSLFEKYNFKENDGSPIKVTTHQFRHYLNTLAQKGGVSQLDIAKWSGRNDIRQNTEYDHTSGDEMIAILQNAIGDENALVGPLNNIDDIKKKGIISREEYARSKVRTAHRTDFGICIHDFSMMPCQLHMDCINCNEQFCIKGDKIGNARLKERKEDVQRLLKIAGEEEKNGHTGANRWAQHHSIELKKLTQLCKILENPNVPSGTIVQVNNIPSSSQIKQAHKRRLSKTKEQEEDFSMEDLQNLLISRGKDL